MKRQNGGLSSCRGSVDTATHACSLRRVRSSSFTSRVCRTSPLPQPLAPLRPVNGTALALDCWTILRSCSIARLPFILPLTPLPRLFLLSPPPLHLFLSPLPLLHLPPRPDSRLPNARPQTRHEKRHRALHRPDPLPPPRVLLLIAVRLLVEEALGDLFRSGHGIAVLLLPVRGLLLVVLRLTSLTLLLLCLCAFALRGSGRLQSHDAIPPSPHSNHIAQRASSHHPESKPNAKQKERTLPPHI